MAFRCKTCGGPCKGEVAQLQIFGIVGDVVISECCEWHVINEIGETVKPEDLPEAQAWIADGAMAQEK